LGELERRLADERPRFDALAEAERTARARADEAAERLATLERLAPPPALDALAAEPAEVDEAARRCAELAEQAATAVEGAEHRLAELPDRRTLEARRGDHAKRADLAATVERGEAAEAEAAAAVEAARRRLADAEEAHRAAVAERERVSVALQAQALVPQLVVGEACPVCGQQVAELPAHAPPVDLDRASAAVAEAEAAVAAARRALEEATTHQARVVAKLDAVRAELAEVDERLAGAPSPEEVARDLEAVG